MDIQEIRRIQLKEIIKQHFNGVASSFAQKIDKEPSYISRIFTEKEEHRRNIGESFAREIEQKLGLPYLFLDPFNRHDTNSVRVEIDNLIIGHLSKDNAIKYRAWLKANNLKKTTCQADALINGGWIRPDSEGFYGVCLDFSMAKMPYLLRT